MHIKNIHCMIEKLAESAKCEVEKGIEQIDTREMGCVTDMLKDLCEAEYYARIAKTMEEAEKEDEEEAKYLLKMLKEEYGDEEGEKRFYSGQPRSRTSGRYMKRGDGRRNNGGRNGYEEHPYFHMTPEMYHNMDLKELRDMDRESMGRMYYSGDGGSGMNGGNMGGSRSGGNSSNTSGGNIRGYSEGYERGYSDGKSDGSNRDSREGRSGRSRRTYMESKELNKGNSQEEKDKKMKELDKYLTELQEDFKEMIEDVSPEEKQMAKVKIQKLMSMI